MLYIERRRVRCRRTLRALVMLVVLTTMAGVTSASATLPSDTLVIVVSAASAVTRISHRHMADLYLGRTTRFENGSPAVPIDQAPGTPLRTAFSRNYLGRSEAQMKAHWSRIIFTGRGRPPKEAATGEAARGMIARDPRAIGYLEPRLVDSTVRIVRVVR